MNTNNIHQGVTEYLMRYEPFSIWYFGFANVEDAEVCITPIPSDRYLEEWVEGGGICQYQFAIGVFSNSPQLPHNPDAGQTEAVEHAFDVQAFMAWIEEQNDDGNLPDLGPGLYAQDVKVLQDVPTITGETDTIQKMLFAGMVEFLEVKE